MKKWSADMLAGVSKMTDKLNRDGTCRPDARGSACRRGEAHGMWRVARFAVVAVMAMVIVLSGFDAKANAAVTATVLDSGSAGGSTTAVSASISPGADNLLLLWVVDADGTGATPTSVTGNGLTWEEVAWENVGTSSRRDMALWRAMGSSPSAGSVTITYGANQDAIGFIIVEYSGVDPAGSSDNGASTIVQSATNAASNATSINATLAALGTGNVVAAGVGVGNNGTPTLESTMISTGFVSISGGGRTAGIAAGFADPGDTTPTFTNTQTNLGTIAVEIADNPCTAPAPTGLTTSYIGYNQVDLAWSISDCTNVDEVRIYRDGTELTGATVPSPIACATSGTFIDDTVSASTTYNTPGYVVEAYNATDTCGAASGALEVTTAAYTTGTTTGAMTFSNVSTTGMTVTVAYTGDDNDSNSIGVSTPASAYFSYGTDGVTYPSTVSATRVGKSWVANVTGLNAGVTYYFEADFFDGDGVNGTDPVYGNQNTKSIQTLHSSGVLGDKYAPWGTTHTCATCHEANNANGNIKRIRVNVSASGETYNNLPMSLSDADGADADFVDYASGTNKVCDVCHTQTDVFRNNGNYSGTGTGTGAIIGGDALAPHPDDNDCIKCHKHRRGFKVNAGCADCHANNETVNSEVYGAYQADTSAPVIFDANGTIVGATAWGSHLKALIGDDVTAFTSKEEWDKQCLKCHDGHVSSDDGVHIPNNPTVGINYDRGYIALGGSATSGTTEAEICWNCHDANGISEWGANTQPSTGNSPYNYGTLTTSNWTTATWSSSRSEFAYKTAPIQSTHSVSSAGSSALDSGGSDYAYYESPDAVENIRCSYCHDVHDLATLGTDVAEGKPYLRGSWMGNPYEEDGAPRMSYAGQDYFPEISQADQNGGTSTWGQVPRGSTAQNYLGGYWIDQNNVVPMSATTTSNGTAARNPTAGWTPADFAGLCLLCHGTGATTALKIDGLDQEGSENLWLGTNGHANSVMGATGNTSSNAFNVFDQRGATTWYDNNPPMNYWDFIPGSTTYTCDPGGRDAGDGPADSQCPDVGFRDVAGDLDYQPRLNGAFDGGSQQSFRFQTTTWATGLTIQTDATAVIDDRYHKFSCSKCHNPHASRLPKLMITNCLDTKHNTWDNQFQLNAVGTNNVNRELANWTSAQNCHRYAGLPDAADTTEARTGAAAGVGNGWNKVTPWTKTTGPTTP